MGAQQGENDNKEDDDQRLQILYDLHLSGGEGLQASLARQRTAKGKRLATATSLAAQRMANEETARLLAIELFLTVSHGAPVHPLLGCGRSVEI